MSTYGLRAPDFRTYHFTFVKLTEKPSNMTKTIEYYNAYAHAFFDSTFEINMSSLYQAFLRYLPKRGKILDVGCGSGRDALYFSGLGYDVEAIDYSEALVELARKNTGLNIRKKSFYDINEIDQYAGIWACASLLHCERALLPAVIQKLVDALTTQGVCYLSFKYGDQNREKDGREFTDLNEIEAAHILKKIPNILLLQQWISSDNRPDRAEEWLNIIFKKVK